MKKKDCAFVDSRITQAIRCYFVTKIKSLPSHAFKVKVVCKKIYGVVSVISTLAIFSAVLLFFIGKLGLETASDDDLIMRNIKKQVPDNLSISSIITYDIHGFGNESIIVLASSEISSEQNKGIANQFLVFDKINNDFLNRVYNLFGYGSSYKLSYLFSLESEYDNEWSFGYEVQLLDIIELTGDLSKEIVVKFMATPAGTSGYYQIGVFSYSFETHSYYLLGTYPPSGKYDCNESPYLWNTPVDTVFNSEHASHYNYYDPSYVFDLEFGTHDDNDFYIESTQGKSLLIRTQMIWDKSESHVEPHRHIISVFAPIYDAENDELDWNVIFSQETQDYTRFCTEDFVKNFLLSYERADIVR